MKKLIRSIVYGALVMGLFSSCLQTPELVDGEASSDFSDSNLNPNIDPNTGLPYVNQPSAPNNSESPSVVSGASPVKSGVAPSNPSNASGGSPQKSDEEIAADLQKQIDEDNAKDMELYLAKQKELEKPAEEEPSGGSGLAPAKGESIQIGKSKG
jgi:hypothetical protein